MIRQLAQNLGGSLLEETGKKGGFNTLSKDQIPAIVGNLVNATLGLVGAVFIILLVYSGYLYMTAGGNEEQVTKATTTIKRCVIGLIIVLAAYAISAFVTSSLLSATK